MTLLNIIKKNQLQARMNRELLKVSLLTTLIGESSAIGKNDGNRETTDQEVLAMIRKFLKGVNEFIVVASKTGNTEALSVCEQEKSILEEYLPTQLSEIQIQGIVESLLQTSTKSPAFKGVAMKHLKENYEGQYDGKLASQMVENILKSTHPL